MRITQESSNAFGINGTVYPVNTLVFTPNEDKTAFSISSMAQQLKTGNTNILFIDVPILSVYAVDDVPFTTWDDPDQDDSGAGTLKDYLLATCYSPAGGATGTAGGALAGNYPNPSLNGGSSTTWTASQSISGTDMNFINGGGILISHSGTAARAGTAMLTAGQKVVSNTGVRANDIIACHPLSMGGTAVAAQYVALQADIVGGESFTIKALKSDGTIETGEASTLHWFIIRTDG